MTIRLFRADDLPDGVPGALFTDGEDAVLLLSSRHFGSPEQYAWVREVANSLLAEASNSTPPRLRAVV